ncbi:rhomboid protein [Artemisia annua]|uniref:Rhomboid protein n=1 Tax=Artemisia annua TaxID=35608 RepID=A0A2U1PA08_ARTAN|nr:rhomboid protein [Artemisia annua]
MYKLVSLRRILQNPRKIVLDSLGSKPLPQRRATLHGHHCYHTSPLTLLQPPTNNLVKIQLPIRRLLHNAYLKPKLSSNIHGQFGFQCRSYSTFYPPLRYRRSHNRMSLANHGMLIGLFATNVAVFLLWRVADIKFMCNNFLLQLDKFKSGRFHTMITSAFSHIQGYHLFLNMLTLCLFGKTIGEKFGSAYLLKLYLAGAFAGSAFFLVHTYFLALSSKNKGSNKHNPSKFCGLGASAAVKPIMLLHVILYSRQKMHNKLRRAILMGMCIFGTDVIMIASRKHKDLTHVSAHMGGSVVAAIAWSRIKRGRF